MSNQFTPPLNTCMNCQDQYDIVHLCPLHSAAFAMYEALKEIRKGCSDGSRIGVICDKATAPVDQSTKGQATPETRS